MINFSLSYIIYFCFNNLNLIVNKYKRCDLMSVNHQKIDFQCPQCGSILIHTLMGFLFCEECDKEFTEEEIRENYST
ncbi:hypothetical protein LCGC14_2458500 [marine sediment metagenome]|uniref:Uncharacterized protein n=2 Tax=marine sediment metagenome TaxID=412755 RepID=A0A0F9BDX2_9ZZZZ